MINIDIFNNFLLLLGSLIMLLSSRLETDDDNRVGFWSEESVGTKQSDIILFASVWAFLFSYPFLLWQSEIERNTW